MPKLAGLAVALSAAALAATAHAGHPAGTFAGCPTGLKPIPADYASTARRLALQFALTHPRGMRLKGAHATQAIRVSHWLPSGWIRSACGLAVWRRSVAVNVTFPAMEYPNP